MFANELIHACEGESLKMRNKSGGKKSFLEHDSTPVSSNRVNTFVIFHLGQFKVHIDSAALKLHVTELMEAIRTI